jgi:hypothetical protein
LILAAHREVDPLSTKRVLEGLDLHLAGEDFLFQAEGRGDGGGMAAAAIPPKA